MPMYRIHLKYTKHLMVMLTMLISCFIVQAKPANANQFSEAKKLSQEGLTAYNEHDYELALKKHEDAWAVILDTDNATKYQQYIQKNIINACLALSTEMIEAKRYNAAHELLFKTLGYAPFNTLLCEKITTLHRIERDARTKTSDAVIAQSKAITIYKKNWYHIPQEFFLRNVTKTDTRDDNDPWAAVGPSSSKRLTDPKTTFSSLGVEFPKNSSAQYSITGVLTVYNTEDNMDKIIDIIDDYYTSQASSNTKKSREKKKSTKKKR